MAEGDLPLGRGFSESEAERRRVEQRIVSEARGAARLVEDDARHRPAKDAAETFAFDQRDYAHEARVPVGYASQLFEQQQVVGLVGRVRAGEAGGMNAGGAAERVHFQARIVREEQAGCVGGIMARFDDGVLFEGVAILDAGGNPVEVGEGLDGDGAVVLEFAQLPGVASGAKEPDQIRATFFCISMIWAMPARARVTNCPICWSSNRVCSAVACTSTNLPAPVITTFMSTPARKSSS